MDIKERMNSKMTEIADLKNEREALFSDFETNKERISELYYEIEIKKLQYMFLKREQLTELKKDEKSAVVAESVSNVESINETCIKLLQKQLIESGFEERIKLII